MAGERTFKCNVAGWDLHSPKTGVGPTPSWNDLANGWAEALALQWAAQDRWTYSSHPVTRVACPPRGGLDFHLEDQTITVARPESLA